MEKLLTALKESYLELTQKVTWPSWSSLQASTIVVLVATVILTTFVFFMDLGSKTLMDFIYALNK
ncbi:MAG TPA: preprotein translocase subunit SecE [Saprospiraceae bacterium]|nr:preprotein translocase subunit SecE [Saprospiraceae bacterium]